MRAIDFCGRASYEKQTDLAFLFCMFGLEALLQSQDNNFVSASITSQMIDAYALIISKDYEDRIKCSNDFQNLYKKRCELAHGGGRNIAEDDYTLALNYLHNLIARFLNDEKLSRIATMKQFKEYVRDLKFQKS